MNWMKKHRGLVIFLALILVFLGWRWHRSQFDPERWAEHPDGRNSMVDNLLKEYDGLVGMTQEEVLTLLGPDTDGEQREETLTPEGPEVRELFAYPIGSRGLGWGYLLVYLQDGVVTGSKILID